MSWLALSAATDAGHDGIDVRQERFLLMPGAWREFVRWRTFLRAWCEGLK